MRIGLFIAVLSLAACNASVSDRAPASTIELKPGYYDLTRNTNGRGNKPFDYAVIGAEQAKRWPISFANLIQSRLQPSYPGGSHQVKDYPCDVPTPKIEGGAFTATGKCTLLKLHKSADFAFSGKAFGDAFAVEVTLSGFGTAVEGKPDVTIIEGHWVKAEE